MLLYVPVTYYIYLVTTSWEDSKKYRATAVTAIETQQTMCNQNLCLKCSFI